MIGRLVLPVLLLFGAVLHFATIWTYSTIGGDFDQDYAAAKSFLNGESIYADDLKQYAPSVSSARIQNNHTPLNVMLYIPWAMFSYQAAFILSGFANILLLYIGIIVLSRHSCFEIMLGDHQKILFGFAIILLWFPTIAATATGQPTGLLFLLWAFFLTSLDNRRLLSASAALAGLIHIKLFPALLLIPLFYILGRQFAIRCCGIILLLALVSLLVFGWEEHRAFIEVAKRNSQAWDYFGPNQSLRSFLYLFLSQSSVQLYWIGSLIMGMILPIILCSAITKKGCQRSLLLHLHFLLTLSFILSPVCWSHYFLLIGPVIVLLLQRMALQHVVSRIELLTVTILLSLPDYYIARYLLEELGLSPHTLPWALLVKLPFVGLVGLLCLLGSLTETASGKSL